MFAAPSLFQRAVRYPKQINIEKPFMFELCPVVGEFVVANYCPKVIAKNRIYFKKS